MVSRLEPPGKLAFLNRSRIGVVTGTPTMVSGTKSSIIGGVAWHNVLIVDPSGGGDYETIQEAIDAAVTDTPSVSNQWLIWITSDDFSENLTLASFVHLRGMSPTGTRIIMSAAHASVANCTLADLTLETDGSSRTFTVSHETFLMQNVRMGLSTNTWTLTATNGRFRDCRFNNVVLNLNGASQDALPILYDCHHESDVSTIRAVTGTGYSEWNGGTMHGEGTAGDVYLGLPTNARVVGAHIRLDDGVFTSTSAKYVGCQIDCEWGLAITVGQIFKVSAGAEFVGCRLAITGSAVGANPAFVTIASVAVGTPTVFDGCYLSNSDTGSLVMFSNAISSGQGAVVFTGCSLYHTGTSGFLFGVHSSGFSGDITVRLERNHYVGQASTLPQPGGGGRIRWTGSDLHAVFVPVAIGRGTGATTEVDHKTVQGLNVAAETAYLTGRVPSTAGSIAEASLVLSAVNTNGLVTDSFTDADGTNLNAHTSDSGETWTAVTGTITVQSNRAQTSGFGIYTQSVAAVNGYAKITRTSGIVNNPRTGIVFRLADASNYWTVYISGGGNSATTLAKVVAGLETIVVTTGTGLGSTNVAVSFYGSVIRVFINGRLAIDVSDSTMSTNTGVGLYLLKPGGGSTTSLDDFSFYPGGTVDITTATNHGIEGFPFDSGSSQVATSVPVIHHAYTLKDVTDAFSIPSDGPQEQLFGVLVTLDALSADITDLYVHGMILRVLPSVPSFQEQSAIYPDTGISYR